MNEDHGKRKGEGSMIKEFARITQRKLRQRVLCAHTHAGDPPFKLKPDHPRFKLFLVKTHKTPSDRMALLQFLAFMVYLPLGY